MKTSRNLVAAVCLVFAGAVFAGDEWYVSCFNETVTKYLWRGENLHEGWAFQPVVELGIGGFAGQVWASYNIVEDTTNSWGGLDYYVVYDTPMPFAPILSLNSGFNLYTIPADYGNYGMAFWTEAFWGLGLDLPGAPSITQNLVTSSGDVEGDVYVANRHYIEMAFSHDTEVKGIGVGYSGAIGYGIAQALDATWEGNPTVAFSDVTLSYSKYADFSFRVGYQYALHSYYESHFVLGLGVGYTFSGKGASE